MHHDTLLRVTQPTTLAISLAAISVLVSAVSAWHAAADDAAKSSPPGDRTRPALHAAVEKNLSYCREWLTAKDWKSLRQTADGMAILTQVLGQRGSGETWLGAADGLADAVRKLQTAADDKQPQRCRELIDGIAAQNNAWAKLTPEKSEKSSKPVASKAEKLPSLRPLMHLMDATHADAKAAVAVGELDEARTMAVVLSELGRVVSNQRADAPWRAAGEALVLAAAAAADDKQVDAKTVRQRLRGVYEKCEECHKRQR